MQIKVLYGCSYVIYHLSKYCKFPFVWFTHTYTSQKYIDISVLTNDSEHWLKWEAGNLGWEDKLDSWNWKLNPAKHITGSKLSIFFTSGTTTTTKILLQVLEVLSLCSLNSRKIIWVHVARLLLQLSDKVKQNSRQAALSWKKQLTILTT